MPRRVVFPGRTGGPIATEGVHRTMHPTAGVSLLIVDDDSRLRDLAEFAARRTSRFEQIRVCPDGHAARELLDRLEDEALPSVILTDLAMPVLDGLEFVRGLQRDARLREIPVAMFSSSNLPDDESLALEAGCRVFFVKPSTLSELEQIMAAVASLALHSAPAPA